MPLLLLLALGLAGRVPLGQFGRWGAFREGGGACLALAEPVARRDDARRPFAAVATAADGGARMLRARLSRPARPGSATARVGGTTRPLATDGVDALLPDARALIAAIRRGTLLRLAATDPAGRRFEDLYPLGGAPSAIDAATVGCLPR